MTKVNKLLELANMPQRGAILDVSTLSGLTANEIKIAEIVSEETEREREKRRKDEPNNLLGFKNFYADSLNWDDLLPFPTVVTACSSRAGISNVSLLDFVIKKCNPKNWLAMFWMGAWYELEGQDKSIDFEKKREELQKDFEKKRAEEASRRGRVAAEAKHGKPGGNRDKQAAIRAAWASGNYATRTLCVTEEYEAIGFKTYNTAKRALENTPNPDPWPAKKVTRSK